MVYIPLYSDTTTYWLYIQTADVCTHEGLMDRKEGREKREELSTKRSYSYIRVMRHSPCPRHTQVTQRVRIPSVYISICYILANAKDCHVLCTMDPVTTHAYLAMLLMYCPTHPYIYADDVNTSCTSLE